MSDLTALGRVRLSEHFFMRDMLYSEVAAASGLVNLPEDSDLAIEAGRNLCRWVLEPLRAGLGHVALRSAYRSPTVNGRCHALHKAGVADSWCASNDDSAGAHIWDRRDRAGRLGATATVVVPRYLDHYEQTGDWRPLAWWIRDHVPEHAEVQFFRVQCAFNIGWSEGPSDRSIGLLDPPTRLQLTAAGAPEFEGDHSPLYRHILPI
ncbi:hypothetical protein [Phenylobacterium sp.]|uniref:hypothetical protein n=1 Tax=Phenylobacterium sp. TaxID=1871053 RepID=UPI0011F630DF|nr:hypothetical protein [Phenylobacterium sp.]THD59055.1 MAG: hypothetical protein E8A49_17355 [Phenylobacterium sp.]